MKRLAAMQRFRSLNGKTAVKLFLCAVILSVPGSRTAFSESAPNQPPALAKIQATIKSLRAEQVNAGQECNSGDEDACGRSEDLHQHVRDLQKQMQRVAKTEVLRAKFAASGKPSYLEQSRHLHVYPDQIFKGPMSSTGFRLDPATLTYFGKVTGRSRGRRVFTGGALSFQKIVPDEGREHLKKIFPLRSGKKWTYDLTGPARSGTILKWSISGEVMEEMIRTDPVIGPIYCFRISYRFSSEYGWSRKGHSTLCPVYGLVENYLKGMAKGLGIDGPFNFSRTKLRPVFVDISGPKVSLKKTVLARFIQGIQDPEAVERQRLLAEAKRKAEKEKRRLAQEARLLGEREAKRRAEERRLAIAKAKRLAGEKRQAEIARAEKDRLLYEELAGSARQYLATVQKYLADNPDTPSVMAIVTQTAGVHTALKKRNGTGIRTGLKALRRTLSREKSFAKYVAAIEADRQKKVAAAARLRREKLAVEIRKKHEDLKSYAGFLKRQIIRNISNPGLTSALIPLVKELQGGLKSGDLGVLTSLRNRAAATLKKHGLTGQYALVEKMIAGVRAAARKKAADDRRRMAAEKKARAAAVRQKAELARTAKRDRALAVGREKYRDAVAVIIGNRKYGNRVPMVEFAVNDASAMRDYLLGMGYRKGNIIFIRNATQSQMIAVFGSRDNHEGKLFSYIRPGESDLTVFYSGHGAPGQKTRKGYLVPVDAHPDAVELNGYPIDVLYENLAKIPSKSTIVFLDACFSGDSPRGMLIRSASPVYMAAKAAGPVKGITVVTAASGQQLASWDEKAKHGLFTKHLLEGLRGKADGKRYGNGDGKVTLAEVKNYLDREMSYQARRRYNRDQRATVHGNRGLVLSTYR